MTPMLLTAILAVVPAHTVPGAPPPPPLTSTAAHRDGVVVSCARDVDAAFAVLDEALYGLAGDIDDLHRRDRARVQRALAAVVAAAEDARERACRAAFRPAPPPVVVAPPPPPMPMVLDERAERALTAALARESFDDGRLRLLDATLRGDVCVTPRQARALIAAHTFGRARLDALARLAPRMIDDGTFAVVYDAFDFESDKRRAQQLLDDASPLPACSLPRPGARP